MQIECNRNFSAENVEMCIFISNFNIIFEIFVDKLYQYNSVLFSSFSNLWIRFTKGGAIEANLSI